MRLITVTLAGLVSFIVDAQIPVTYGYKLTDIDSVTHFDQFERAGSCASPDGAMNSTVVTPPSYAWLQANGYCNPNAYGAPVTICWTFTTASTSVTINSGWASNCVNASFGSFTLYNSACVVIGTGLTYTGLTIGADYTWCMSGNAWGGGGCTGFTDFCPYFFNNSMLPVSLISFAGYNNGSENTLIWSTASEIANDFFTVEHSVDGISWEELSEIDGAVNSTETLVYDFTHENAPKRLNYYRLSQSDFDGTLVYHGIVSIDNANGLKPELVRITDLMGREVREDYRGIRLMIYSDGTVQKLAGL